MKSTPLLAVGLLAAAPLGVQPLMQSPIYTPQRPIESLPVTFPQTNTLRQPSRK